MKRKESSLDSLGTRHSLPAEAFGTSRTGGKEPFRVPESVLAPIRRYADSIDDQDRAERIMAICDELSESVSEEGEPRACTCRKDHPMNKDWACPRHGSEPERCPNCKSENRAERKMVKVGDAAEHGHNPRGQIQTLAIPCPHPFHDPVPGGRVDGEGGED